MTVFEALHKTVGYYLMVFQNSDYLKKLVQSEVDGVAALGVDFETNVVVGVQLQLMNYKNKDIKESS